MISVMGIRDIPKHFDSADFVISILDPTGSEARDFKLRGDRSKHFIARFEDTEHPSDKEWFQMNREVRNILTWAKDSISLRIQQLFIVMQEFRAPLQLLG